MTKSYNALNSETREKALLNVASIFREELKPLYDHIKGADRKPAVESLVIKSRFQFTNCGQAVLDRDNAILFRLFIQEAISDYLQAAG